jgi:hypothetical protein
MQRFVLAIFSGALLGAVSVDAAAHAYVCPPDYRPYVEVAWPDETAGFAAGAIEQRGKVFAWRPRADGVWFLRVERKASARAPARAPAGAVVVAYERAARVKATVVPSLRAEWDDGGW